MDDGPRLLLLLWDQVRLSLLQPPPARADGDLEGGKTTDLLPNHIPTREFRAERFLRPYPPQSWSLPESGAREDFSVGPGRDP